MKEIKDKFTKRTVSRQRKWQLRKEAAGQCRKCAKPAVTKFHCLDCAVKTREKERVKRGSSRRNLRAYSYRVEAEIKKATKKPVPKPKRK